MKNSSFPRTAIPSQFRNHLLALRDPADRLDVHEKRPRLQLNRFGVNTR